MNKYDFMQNIFQRKDLTAVQKDRLFRLVNREMKNDTVLLENLETRVKRLEEDKSKISLDNSREDGVKSKNYKLKPYISPKKTSEFLLGYNQNAILKSTCHEIDSNELNNIISYCGGDKYVFKEHLLKILEEYSKYENKLAPSFIKAIIRGYLTGKNHEGTPLVDGWSSESIQVSWSSPELLEWSNNNNGIPPNLDEGLMNSLEKTGFEFSKPFLLKKSKKKISNFSELTLFFKKLFHIRGDNSLLEIIKSINQLERFKDKIDFIIDNNNFPKNIEFFTDVDKLIQGYGKILDLIIEVSKIQEKRPKLELTLVETENTVSFSLLHLDSIYGKSLLNFKSRLGNSYKNLINNQLNGVCDFYLKADFEDGNSYLINIWNKKDLWNKIEPEIKHLEAKVGGVMHILEILK